MSRFTVIDEAPVSTFHRRLLIACCGGPFLDGYIISLIGVAMTGILADIPVGPIELGLIGTSSLVGVFFGATVFGALTDKIGREKMYALDLTVLVAACALTAFVTASWQLILLRFVIGLAIGADYPIATSLLKTTRPGKINQREPANHGLTRKNLAETEGFEPSVPLRGLHLSRVVH